MKLNNITIHNTAEVLRVIYEKKAKKQIIDINDHVVGHANVL